MCARLLAEASPVLCSTGRAPARRDHALALFAHGMCTDVLRVPEGLREANLAMGFKGQWDYLAKFAGPG